MKRMENDPASVSSRKLARDVPGFQRLKKFSGSQKKSVRTGPLKEGHAPAKARETEHHPLP
jgi:hypothetical protein